MLQEPKRLVYQMFDLLEVEGLTFIPIKVRLLLFGKSNFFFLF